MYIDYETFDEYEEMFNNSDCHMVSPGWVAMVFKVTRQSVNYWINNDIIDAHRCKGEKGQSGHYVLISESEYPKILEFRKGRK